MHIEFVLISLNVFKNVSVSDSVPFVRKSVASRRVARGVSRG